jgi:hypothetical protein
LLLSFVSTAAAQEVATPSANPPLPAPVGLTAVDQPWDAGGAILLTWQPPAAISGGDGAYRIERGPSSEGPFSEIGSLPAGTARFVDREAFGGAAFVYRVTFEPASGGVSTPAFAGPIAARPNGFRTDRVNALVLVLLLTGLVLFFIWRARSGARLFVRRISGLNAIDEAIGRATEMGRKILYVPGIQSMDEIQTIAALAILGYVGKLSATYGAELDVPNRDPLTFAAARETVKHAYLEAGRPDLFREEIVNYVTYDQFAFTAAVTGRMVRERPAANFFIGSFYAESLILSEMGQTTGAIQIAGTAEVMQLPFFVATCDYTLIGEELYAASAYLSHEPVLLGSIKGQDMMKAVLLIVGVIGVVLATMGFPIVSELLTMH